MLYAREESSITRILSGVHVYADVSSRTARSVCLVSRLPCLTIGMIGARGSKTNIVVMIFCDHRREMFCRKHKYCVFYLVFRHRARAMLASIVLHFRLVQRHIPSIFLSSVVRGL